MSLGQAQWACSAIKINNSTKDISSDNILHSYRLQFCICKILDWWRQFNPPCIKVYFMLDALHTLKTNKKTYAAGPPDKNSQPARAHQLLMNSILSREGISSSFCMSLNIIKLLCTLCYYFGNFWLVLWNWKKHCHSCVWFWLTDHESWLCSALTARHYKPMVCLFGKTWPTPSNIQYEYIIMRLMRIIGINNENNT